MASHILAAVDGDPPYYTPPASSTQTPAAARPLPSPRTAPPGEKHRAAGLFYSEWPPRAHGGFAPYCLLYEWVASTANPR